MQEIALPDIQMVRMVHLDIPKRGMVGLEIQILDMADLDMVDLGMADLDMADLDIQRLDKAHLGSQRQGMVDLDMRLLNKVEDCHIHYQLAKSLFLGLAMDIQDLVADTRKSVHQDNLKDYLEDSL